MVLITISQCEEVLEFLEKAIEKVYYVYKGSLIRFNLSEIKHIEMRKRICNYLFL